MKLVWRILVTFCFVISLNSGPVIAQSPDEINLEPTPSLVNPAPVSPVTDQLPAPGSTQAAVVPALRGSAADRQAVAELQLAQQKAATSVNGPFRNDPAQGIPKHAYSPFDNPPVEPTCALGSCDYQPGVVLVKFTDAVLVKSLASVSGFSAQSELNSALANAGVLEMEPIFINAKPPALNATVENADGQAVPLPDLTRWYRAKLSPAVNVVDAVKQLQSDPNVAWAEPDYLRKPIGDLGEIIETRPAAARDIAPKIINPIPAFDLIPDASTDPLYSQQWHLGATNVPQAWAYLESLGLPPGGNRDIIVAVIDTGVDLNHPDLAANLWTNSREIAGNGIDDDGNGYVDDLHGADTVHPDGDPMDDHGHGTHVAGIIAAQAGNGLGGVGVAYNVQIMAIKAAQYSGMLAASDIAEAIYYALAQGADVINMSFGGYSRSNVEEDALTVAFGQAVLVAAAGNNSLVNQPCFGGRDMYPAAYNWVLGVMASTQGGGLASFSNSDCTPHDTHEYELMAPGVGIWSTLPNEQYSAWSGTSMAAPVVSGIAALARTKWADKDVYSSRYIMGQIAANTAGGTGGVADAYAALTTAPNPELRYLQHWLFDTIEQSTTNDNDGIVDAGETVDLAIVIRNHWGKADPVTVTIDTLESWGGVWTLPDPYVTMITDTVDYGAIGSFNWDDNGLIYDAEGAIIGIRFPFRFSVSPSCPNDHIIPFNLTITAGNGYSSDDPNAPYITVSRFYLVVQRGRELPRIITDDMVLDNDYYWLVPDQTLIESNVNVTITEGTQVQFWSADPQDPYSSGARPYLQVEGSLSVEGTALLPVELFNGSLYYGFPVDIRDTTNGLVSLTYARLQNPQISGDTMDHSYITQEEGDGTRVNGSLESENVAFFIISSTILDGLGWRFDHRWYPIFSSGTQLLGNLFDGNKVTIGTNNGQNNVFLLNRRQDGFTFYPSRASQMGYTCLGCEGVIGRASNMFRNNAFLNAWWNPDLNTWMRIETNYIRDYVHYITDNYWNPGSSTLIDAAINDYQDNFNLARYVYEPTLVSPPGASYPFVVDVVLSSNGGTDLGIVGMGSVTFTVTFNRDMDTAIQPQVSFGPDVPLTDYTVHPIGGGWQDARTWQGTFNINPITGDGYQLIRVAKAVSVNDPWLVTGDDAGRFRFEIITSGTEAMNLQANGGEGYIDLSWTQTDFDLLAGFNLYRATSADGTYSRINSSIIPENQRIWQDTNVTPGQPYYYKFAVVKSDMSESDFSNVATATPIDTIVPVIVHTPVTHAQPGLGFSLYADVTDNVGVQGVTLFYRNTGDASYLSKEMLKTTGNRYSAALEGSYVTSPGIDYYIQASDGVSLVRDGQPTLPHVIAVVDAPSVTTVSPASGPAGGGTVITISGANFKTGAVVTFGGAAASNVTVVSSNQITCVTPAHFPETVDVRVTNLDAQTGQALRAFTFISEKAVLGLPEQMAGHGDVVEISVSAANVSGLVASDLTITFDASVLRVLGVRTGTLTPGWLLETNTATSGQVRLSMIGSGAVSGSGTLAIIEAEVIGSPGVSSVLSFTDVLLNDGAIPYEIITGTFQVELVHRVEGAITYWNGGAVVSGTLLTLDGDNLYHAASGVDGTYTVQSIESGAYTLTPSKSDEVNGISALDASRVLRHAAGLELLTGNAWTAGDVNRSGAVTSMDAFYILQKAVGLIEPPFTGAGRVFDFAPQTHSYPTLAGDLTGQNFSAILLGDVTGNWAASATNGIAALQDLGIQSISATLAIANAPTVPGQRITVPITLALTSAELYGVDLTITYDTNVLTAIRVDKGALATNWTKMDNLLTPGVIRISLAGSRPISQSGQLVLLVFDTVGDIGEFSDLTFTRADLNESAVSATSGRVTVYTPVASSFSAAPTSGIAPMGVIFTNTSSGDYSNALWTFGDGGTSTLASPSYTYTSPGSYTVTLTVSGNGGSDVETKSSFITVRLGTITGTVRYWNALRAMTGVTMTVSGDAAATVTTTATGSYTASGLYRGNYIITPSKANVDDDAITAYDASLILRHSSGLITLTSYALTAADVTSDGTASAYDASYVLRKAAKLITLPFPDRTSSWMFDPQDRTYTGFSADVASQDYTALLLGDVSGNWGDGVDPAALAIPPTVTLRLRTGLADALGYVTTTVDLIAGSLDIYSFDLAFAYAVGSVDGASVVEGSVMESWFSAVNTSEAGMVYVALAGAQPITGEGRLLSLRFKLLPGQVATGLAVINSVSDEGATSVYIDSSEIKVWLPLITRR